MKHADVGWLEKMPMDQDGKRVRYHSRRLIGHVFLQSAVHGEEKFSLSCTTFPCIHGYDFGRGDLEEPSEVGRKIR